VSEFDEVDHTNYPSAFHVSEAPSEKPTITKFRRNKLPPLSPELYKSGPCLVEHNDWGLHKECAKNISVDDSHDDNYVEKDSPTGSEDHVDHSEDVMISDDVGNICEETNQEQSEGEVSEEKFYERRMTKGVTRRLRRTLDALQVLVSVPPLAKKKILEICTWTEQITKVAKERGWNALPSVSLETGYDLTTSAGRKMAMSVLEKQRPDVVVVAWPCTVWSALQSISTKTPEYAERLQQRRAKQMSLLRFVLWIFSW